MSRFSRPPSVRRRIVLHAPGFEPVAPSEHCGRFAGTLARTARTWAIEAEAGPGAPSGDGTVFVFHAHAAGPDWRTEAEIRLAGLLGLAGRYLHLDILLADWRFAIDVARGRHAAYAARITRFADEIAAALGRPGVDEVLLVGHSLGAVFAVEALAEALRRDPGLLRAGPRFALVGLGPSVLKIALHPAAGRLRAALARLADTPGLVWVDHSSRRDVLSFERSEPIATLGLPGHGPRLERVHPRDIVDAATWSRIRHRPLRIHRQYVLGNTRRYSLDFGLLSCGPLPVESGLRPDRVLGPDGALGAGSAADREASAPVPEPAA